jgi:hypothetical protein
VSGSGTSALLSDGSIVFGTWTGCLVRVVDQGAYGTTEGITAHTGGIFGIAVETKDDLEGDRIYVATTGANRNVPGTLSKTSLLRLKDDRYQDLEWVFEAGKAVSSGWLGDAAGILSSPVLYYDETVETTFLYTIVTDWSDTTEGGGWADPERGWIVKVPADGPFNTYTLGPEPPVGAGQQWIYEDTPVDVLALEVNGAGYPAFNCTMDGNHTVWIHGGKNRPEGGKILRTDKDLTPLVTVFDGDTVGFGYSELLLGDDFMYAVAMGAWYPKEVRNDLEKPIDWHDRFRPVISKLGRFQRNRSRRDLGRPLRRPE